MNTQYGRRVIINSILCGEITVIRLSKSIGQGEEITADCIENVKVKKSTAPGGIITNANMFLAAQDKYFGG